MVENKNVPWIPKGVLGVVWDLVLDIVELQGRVIASKKELQPKLEKFLDIVTKKCFIKQT